MVPAFLGALHGVVVGRGVEGFPRLDRWALAAWWSGLALLPWSVDDGNGWQWLLGVALLGGAAWLVAARALASGPGWGGAATVRAAVRVAAALVVVTTPAAWLALVLVALEDWPGTGLLVAAVGGEPLVVDWLADVANHGAAQAQVLLAAGVAAGVLQSRCPASTRDDRASAVSLVLVAACAPLGALLEGPGWTHGAFQAACGALGRNIATVAWVVFLVLAAAHGWRAPASSAVTLARASLVALLVRVAMDLPLANLGLRGDLADTAWGPVTEAAGVVAALLAAASWLTSPPTARNPGHRETGGDARAGWGASLGAAAATVVGWVAVVALLLGVRSPEGFGTASALADRLTGWLGTGLLVGGAVAACGAVRSRARGDSPQVTHLLAGGAGLLVAGVVVAGSDWVRLVRQGWGPGRLFSSVVAVPVEAHLWLGWRAVQVLLLVVTAGWALAWAAAWLVQGQPRSLAALRNVVTAWVTVVAAWVAVAPAVNRWDWRGGWGGLDALALGVAVALGATGWWLVGGRERAPLGVAALLAVGMWGCVVVTDMEQRGQADAWHAEVPADVGQPFQGTRGELGGRRLSPSTPGAAIFFQGPPEERAPVPAGMRR
jgi:hypothetical protein